jgi:hypothetical protein
MTGKRFSGLNKDIRQLAWLQDLGPQNRRLAVNLTEKPRPSEFEAMLMGIALTVASVVCDAVPKLWALRY